MGDCDGEGKRSLLRSCKAIASSMFNLGGFCTVETLTSRGLFARREEPSSLTDVARVDGSDCLELDRDPRLGLRPDLDDE